MEAPTNIALAQRGSNVRVCLWESYRGYIHTASFKAFRTVYFTFRNQKCGYVLYRNQIFCAFVETIHQVKINSTSLFKVPVIIVRFN
jgi:hypothetical protein